MCAICFAILSLRSLACRVALLNCCSPPKVLLANEHLCGKHKQHLQSLPDLRVSWACVTTSRQATDKHAATFEHTANWS